MSNRSPFVAAPAIIRAQPKERTVREKASGVLPHPARTTAPRLGTAWDDAVWALLLTFAFEHDRLLEERAELQARERTQREALAHLEALVGMAGHELRSPLTAAKASVQLALRRMRRDPAQDTPTGSAAPMPMLSRVREALTQMDHQLDRLSRFVDDVLDVTRVQKGKQLALDLVPTNLVVLAGEIVAEQRLGWPGRTILFASRPDEAVWVEVDRHRIGQVMTNFLTNALKYSPPDQAVEVRVEEHEREARLCVRDGGPGLPKDEQERIWERFYQAHGIQQQDGSGAGLGLGLSISRTIVEQHQGEVGVDSIPGDGCTFWFTLPLARTPQDVSSQ
jgi:signal transduction histidine kinase